jgi:hypothetical protein
MKTYEDNNNMSNETTVLSILNTFIHSSDISALIANFISEIKYIYSNVKGNAVYTKTATSNVINPIRQTIRIGGDVLNLVSITAIGKVYITKYATFSGCKFLESIPKHIVIKTNNLSDTFLNCHRFNQDISHWDVSNVEYMNEMFKLSGFNQPLNNWDVSSLKFAYCMFSGSAFNQPLNNWNTINLINISYMFYKTNYNQDISDWNTDKLCGVNSMFSDSKTFRTSQMFNDIILKWNLKNINSIGAFTRLNKVHFDEKCDINKCNHASYLITVYAGDLKKICKVLKINGYSGKRKYELIKMILEKLNN